MGIYFTSPDDHLDVARKVTTKLIKKSFDCHKRGPDTSALQTVIDEVSAAQKHLDALKPEVHPEWEGFGPNDIGYLLRELKIAAAIIRGEFKLYTHVCVPNDEGKCVKDFHFQKTTVDQLRSLAASHYAPTLYAISAEYAATHTDQGVENFIKEYGGVWLGDVAHDGHTICGELLSLILE